MSFITETTACGVEAGSRGEPLIRVQALTTGYGERIILRDVNLEVFPGEVVILLGGSGCGKSTLLKQMIGLERPMSGTVLISGRDVHAARGAERTRILHGFGVSYQSGALFGSLSVLENVLLPLEECTDLPKPLQLRVARMKLAQVGLAGFENHAPSELSGGMVKRAAIARAMVLDPCILFLDEPSAGLDPVTSAELDALILDLARGLGMTFVIVTHELASVFAIADRVIMLDKSRQGIVAQGDPRTLRDHSTDSLVHDFFHRHVTGKDER
ncbi:ABC transporter ATP-binding protein [Desulfonatronum thiodismutans]|uniref:ABC transporter ATP-binding protein n=1 Tax=Desulfonatronum thiodismutans TaxID=159290 RepID=UPI00068A5D16|nr:ATP-binding cassette domain-containing protein [Desulfonatronum thiodismutans]